VVVDCLPSKYETLSVNTSTTKKKKKKKIFKSLRKLQGLGAWHKGRMRAKQYCHKKKKKARKL
jgi:hypothetical protein